MSAPTDALNPRYVAYARACGRSVIEQEEFDRKAYPGGWLAGFFIWIGEQKRAFAAKHPESMRGDDIGDQEAWDCWLESVASGRDSEVQPTP